MIWIFLIAVVIAAVITVIVMRGYLNVKGGSAAVKQYELPEGSDKPYFEDPQTGKRYDKEAYEAYLQKTAQRMTDPQLQALISQYGNRTDIWNRMMCDALRAERVRREEAAETASAEAEEELDAINEEIAPFFWVEQAEGASVGLTTGTYLQDLFDTRAAEGFSGNGHDWDQLARLFLREQNSNLAAKLEFDSQEDMFCVYSRDTDVLKKFIRAFKAACENREQIAGLFSRVKKAD